MLKNFIKILSVCLFLITPTLAKNFDQIIITGNIRISNETIKVFSEIPENKNVSENSLNLILKNLYNTGFFKDVSVKIDNNKLLINVVENPIIQTLTVNGIKTKKLTKKIDDVLILKDRSSFNLSKVKKDKISIINTLKEEGYYFSKVDISTKELNDNKIDLIYSIELGDKAKISKISFVGDKIFKDKKLRNIIVSEEYKFWKFLSGKKFLNENIINLDTRLLYNFYRNNGFYNIKIESSFANYVGNNEFELIFNINADKKYYFNDLKLNLPPDYDISNFQKLTTLFTDLKGQPYSLNSINKILKEIDKIALYERYEFLSSTVNEKTNKDLIDFEFNINEIEKLYIEKINIFGNNITQEEVIRSNLEIDEGDGFNNLLHNKSINNIKSLNFFSNVKSEVIKGSSDKQKIINISVDEKPTGEISAGAGIGTSGGTVGFSVKENNFLGRGVQFGSDFNLSSDTVTGILSLTNPNHDGTNRSLSLSAESTITDRLATYGYKSTKTGFSASSGFEYYEDLFVNTGISTYSETITSDSTASTAIKNNTGKYITTYFNYALTYDKRNQKFQSTDGYKSRFTQSLPIVARKATVKSTYDLKIYNEWIDKNILSFNYYAAIANSLTGKNILLSDRIFVPPGRLRGFESGKFGPRDGKSYIGGNYAMAFNAVTTVPQILPNSEIVDFILFFDAANVWGVDYSSAISGSKVRSAIGIGVDIFTPIGPLNFSLAETITKGKNDVTETFRFNLGTSF